MYSYIYSFIQKIILKKSLNSDAGNLLEILNFKNIIDIGCGESDVLNYIKLDKDQNYYGYEVEDYFINKLKKKNRKKNLYFEKKRIEDIDFNKFKSKDTIILLIGIFHHLDDKTIKSFLKKTKNFHVFSIDAVILPGQNLVTKLLFFFDKGKHIRKLNNYKKIIKGFNYKIIRNRYLRLPYDHLMCFKKINKRNIEKILEIKNN